MRRLAVVAALALGVLVALSSACGLYGPPRRVSRPAPEAAPAAPVETVPLTDPAVSP